MGFVVCEDLADAGDTKIHRDTCGYYRGRDPGASTMQWHGPYARHDDAVAAAQQIAASKSYGYRDAGCCMRARPARDRQLDREVVRSREPPNRNRAASDVEAGTTVWTVRGQPVAWAGGEPEQGVEEPAN